MDVLLLTDHIFQVGTVVLGKIIAALEAVQVEGRRKQRNDRLISLPVEMVAPSPMLPAIVFNSSLRNSITEFFIKYNELQRASCE